MEAQGTKVGMEVEAKEEAYVEVVHMEVVDMEGVDTEAVDMEAVDMEAVDTEATQEAASASRASMEAKEQKKLCRCRRCLQAICSTLRPSMGQLVPVAIATGQPAITGVGIRIKIREGVGIRHIWILTKWRN